MMPLAIGAILTASCTKETIIVQNITMVDTTTHTVPETFSLALTPLVASAYGTLTIGWQTNATTTRCQTTVRMVAQDTNEEVAQKTSEEPTGEMTVHHLPPGTRFLAYAEMRRGETTVATAETPEPATTPKAPECTIAQPTPPEAIDLGLSVLWADRNLGASAPEEGGAHVAWGELRTKTRYDERGWATPDFVPECISGSVYYDVCHRAMGHGWRLPTASEIRELRERCTWRLVDHKDGRMEVILTGPNGDKITLPCAGAMSGEKVVHEDDFETYRSGYYMTGERGVALRFAGNEQNPMMNAVRTKQEMWMGLSVRAVRDRE